MSKLILIRGLPGAGKTTLADRLMIEEDAMHFEADHFMENEGTYEFNSLLLDAAHNWCLGQAIYNLKQGTNVIVSNTFTQIWEIEPYVFNAAILDCEVEVIHVVSQFKSIHNIPDIAFNSMRRRFQSNEKVEEKLRDLHHNIKYKIYPDA